MTASTQPTSTAVADSSTNKPAAAQSPPPKVQSSTGGKITKKKKKKKSNTKKGQKKQEKSFTDAEKAECFAACDDHQNAEWDAVFLTKKSASSKVWEHIHQVRLKDGIEESDLYNKSKALQLAKHCDTFVCTFCKEQEKSLSECLLKLKNGQPSNGNSHLKTMHSSTLAMLKEEEQERVERLTKRKKEEKPKKTQQTITLIGEPRSKRQKVNPTNEQRAANELNQKIFLYVNNGGRPRNTCEDPKLRDIVSYCIQHADLLKKYQHMGRAKFSTLQCSNFADFTTKVTALVTRVREWWVRVTGERQPFMSVAQDVWDGKSKQINGLTIFFIDPSHMTVYCIPIALLKPLGKSGIELCRTCMCGLDRYGIEMEDLYRSVNDNCTTAKSAGRLTLSFGDEEKAEEAAEGCCYMHLGHLYTGLSLSLVPRKKNGKVCNYWAPFRDPYARLKEMAKYVCDRKNKRYDDYKLCLADIGKPARLINIPNSTRVGQALMLIQDCLCSMHSLRFYGMSRSKFQPKVLTQEEWELMAEFEAVMRKASLLCFDVQSDRVEVACETVFELSALKMYYEEHDQYDVVDTTKSWTADTPFADLPRTIRTRKAHPDMHRLSEKAIELIHRFVSNYDEYFAKSDPDRLLAMIVHPLMAKHGFAELEIMRDDGAALFRQAKALLVEAVIDVSRKMNFAGDTSTNGSGSDNVRSQATSPAASRAEKLEQHRRKKMGVHQFSSSMSHEEFATKAVNAYLQSEFDPVDELKDQCRRMGKFVVCDKEEAINWDNMPDSMLSKYMPHIDWDKVQKLDTLYICGEFDILEWWDTIGKKKHQLVVLVMLAILALPPTNAFLERIFSTCTWFDNPLRQRLQFNRFEVSVLLAVNESFLGKEPPSLDEGKAIVEKVIGIFTDADPTVDPALDLDLDVDAEDFEVEKDDDEKSEAG